MATNCTLCGVSMTTVERPTNKRGQAAPLHNDCALLEDTLYWEQKWNPRDTARIAELNTLVGRMTAKRGGSVGGW